MLTSFIQHAKRLIAETFDAHKVTIAYGLRHFTTHFSIFLFDVSTNSAFKESKSRYKK